MNVFKFSESNIKLPSTKPVYIRELLFHNSTMWCLNLRENTLHHDEQRNCLVFARRDAGERGGKKLKFKLKIILPNWCYHLQRGLKWIYLYSRNYSANCILNSSSSYFVVNIPKIHFFVLNENCWRNISRIFWWNKKCFQSALRQVFVSSFISFEIDEEIRRRNNNIRENYSSLLLLIQFKVWLLREKSIKDFLKSWSLFKNLFPIRFVLVVSKAPRQSKLSAQTQLKMSDQLFTVVSDWESEKEIDDVRTLFVGTLNI